jgi:hypothetical protein
MKKLHLKSVVTASLCAYVAIFTTIANWTLEAYASIQVSLFTDIPHMGDVRK